jgi:hypothetical protein
MAEPLAKRQRAQVQLPEQETIIVKKCAMDYIQKLFVKYKIISLSANGKVKNALVSMNAMLTALNIWSIKTGETAAAGINADLKFAQVHTCCLL